MLVTMAGMVTLVKLAQEINAWDLILVTLLGIVKSPDFPPGN